MLKVLHTGDWHIGSFPGPEVGGQNARFQDICRCLDFQAMYAEEHRPDLIVVSGDIFHQARVWSDRGLRESRTAIDHIRRLSNVAPTVVLRGTPNHDSEEQFEMLTTAFYGDDSVSVVTEPEVLHIHTYHGQRVDVACIPGFDRGVHRAAHPGLSREEETQMFTDELAKVVLGLKAQCEPGVTSILSTHFTVPGCNMESGQTALFAQFEPVIYPDTLKAADFDLVALGHIHRPQQLPEAGRAVFYCGSICYKQKKASEIFKDCCDRFQIPYKDVADTGYVISELPKAKTTACDVILDALSLTFKATGIRHYVTSADGKLSLIKRKDSILQWVVETGRNLISYDYTCSIEKVKTRIKLLSKEDKVLAEKADTELEKTIGIMQDISTPDSNTEEANLTDMAESMLAEQKLPSKTLTIEGLGQANVISGVGLCIIIRPLGISNSYYVDEDTHTFKGNYHSMRLTLNMATDTERSAKASDEKSSTSHSVGDKVQFSGGPQYVASTATSPTNSPKAGPAKITAIAKSKNAKHPYHIIHTDKQSTVYGWVDASQIG